jgi:signal transduction histidine kinase
MRPAHDALERSNHLTIAGRLIQLTALLLLGGLVSVWLSKSLPATVLLMVIPAIGLVFGLFLLGSKTARGELVEEPEALRMAGWTLSGAVLFLGIGGWFYGLQAVTNQVIPLLTTTTLTLTTLGTFVGAIVGFYNSRHRSKARALREREAELDEQNERLENFASIVSHDLRNPLTVASGHLDLLQQKRSDEHVQAVDDALDRMERLIDDLLTMARDAETVKNPDSLHFKSLVRAAWQTVDPNEATLEILGEGQIRAEESRAQELLENLFDNAVSHGGPNVTVRVEPLEDGFAVADDGPGIPEDKQDEIFEAGHSGDPDGTGFGLYIVDLIAGAHEWEIDLTDSEDGGARFEFHGVKHDLERHFNKKSSDGDGVVKSESKPKVSPENTV